MATAVRQDQTFMIAKSAPLWLGAIDTSPGTARASARAQLAAWGRADLIDDVEAITSELIANAVEASEQGGTAVGMRLVLTADALVIEIYDQAPGEPSPRPTGPDSESGRGLAIVDSISDRWGWSPARAGKVVWARLSA